MATSQAQQNIERAASKKARDERVASIMAQRKQAQAQMRIERDDIVKATGQDKHTVGRQLKDAAHSASLKRIYGKDLDTSNPAAVSAARAAKDKEAAARQTRDPKQVRFSPNTQRAADLDIDEKEAEKQNAADRIAKEGADRIAARDAQDNALRAVKFAPHMTTSPTPKATLPIIGSGSSGGMGFGSTGGSGVGYGSGAKQSSGMGYGSSSGGLGSASMGGTMNKTMDEMPMRKGGSVKQYAKGGSVSASSRGDGIAQRGKTKGRMC